MDDLIYFLFLIAWLAFSFYQQSAKKKKKQEQMKAQRVLEQQLDEQDTEEYSGTAQRESQPVTVASQEQDRGRDFKKTLEEILLGEEFVERTPAEPVQRRNATRAREAKPEEADWRKKNIYQKYYDDEMLGGSLEDKEKEPRKLVETVRELEENMALQQEETEEDVHESTGFDLRQAIIYSEIINRRYTN